MRLASLRISIITLALLLFVSCSSKETSTTGSSLSALLPASGELTGYSQSTAPSSFGRDKAWDYLGQTADKFLYNGFQEGAKAQYSSGDKSRTMVLEIMMCESPVYAYKIYTFLRTSSARPTALSPRGYIGGDTLVFLKGNYVGRAVGSGSNAEADMTAAAKIVLSKLPDSLALPIQLQLFPKEGLIPNSESVTIDDIGGLTWDSNLFGVKYLLGEDTAQVYLRLETVDGPTVAVKRFIGDKGRIKSYLMDCGYQALTALDENGQLVFCAIDKGVLCTVVGRFDQKVAQEMVSKVYANAAKMGLK